MKLVLEECGCCGCYHPINFIGDCRDDNNRYPTDNPLDKKTPKRISPPKNIWQHDSAILECKCRSGKCGEKDEKDVKIFEKTT